MFNATSLQLIPATPAKVRIFCKPSLEWACSLSISPPQPAHLGHLHPSLTLPHGRPSPLTSVGGSESSTPTRHLGWHFRPHSSQVLNAIRYTDVIQSNTLHGRVTLAATRRCSIETASGGPRESDFLHPPRLLSRAGLQPDLPGSSGGADYAVGPEHAGQPLTDSASGKDAIRHHGRDQTRRRPESVS